MGDDRRDDEDEPFAWEKIEEFDATLNWTTFEMYFMPIPNEYEDNENLGCEMKIHLHTDNLQYTIGT